MQAEQIKQPTARISVDQLLSVVRVTLGGYNGYEDPEHPMPRGPWDPVIRIALERINVFRPQPEPWKEMGGFRMGEKMMLNPQPIPPRYAFLSELVQAVVARAELLNELNQFTHGTTESRSNVGSRYINHFVDEWCPVGKVRWPFPWPRPKWWFTKEELTATDYLVIATQLEFIAKEFTGSNLEQDLKIAVEKFTTVGISKM